MFTAIRNFFSAPVFPGNESKTRRARLLHVMLVAQTYVLVFTLTVTLISIINDHAKNRSSEIFVMSGGLLLIVLWRFFMSRGWISAASIGMIVFFTLSITAILASGGTIRSAGVIFYPLSVVMGSLLVNRQTGVVFFILTSLIAIGLVQGEIAGVLPPPSNEITFSSNAIVVAGMGLTLVLLNLATQSTDDALKQAHEKEQQVRELASNLEKRVAERTRALTTSTEVSRSLSTILDIDQLVREVVEQVKSSFNYYHAHIYLMDESGKELLMAGGTGEAGKIMLARGHKIQVGKGLVGLAAETKELIRVSDTTEDPDWLPNPLLPDTKSEIAVPITLGDRVLGVLDVQQNVKDGLREEDSDLLQSIAYQVAVAVRNAQVFSETQQQAERGTLINEIGRKIQNTASVEQALQVAARELGLALGARDTYAIIDLENTKTTRAS